MNMRADSLFCVSKRHFSSSAFTIVELLVVIVVIGILAAITVVSYGGITSRATAAFLTSDLNNASKQLKLDQVLNGTYPATLAASNGGKGIPVSSGTVYQYAVDNTAKPPIFCITLTKDTVSYKVTNDSLPLAGNCANFGRVINLDAGDLASYPGSGTTWTDLSGNGNNGTLMNGVAFTSADGGAFIFDGVNDFVRIPNSASINPGSNSWSISTWFKMNTAGSHEGSILYNKEQMYEASPGGGEFNHAWQPNWNWFGSTSINLGEWYNVVVTYDGANQYVYKNGTLVYSRVQTGVMGSNTNEFDIGARNAGTTAFIPATISNLQMHNRALSSDEITQNFNTLRGRYGL
jgi:prepilin-type N-terminal cleavage/methylation domain-containing protein